MGVWPSRAGQSLLWDCYTDFRERRVLFPLGLLGKAAGAIFLAARKRLPVERENKANLQRETESSRIEGGGKSEK